MRQRIDRPQTLDSRVGNDFQLGRNDRYGQRNVESIRDAERHERRELADRCLNRVHRRHDVFAPPEQLGVVVSKDCGHPIEIEPFSRIEGEPLRRVSQKIRDGLRRFQLVGQGWARSFESFAERRRGSGRTRR